MHPTEYEAWARRTAGPPTAEVLAIVRLSNRSPVMELIVKVTSTNPATPLSDLLRLPLGLDIWEVKPEYLILRASEAPIERLTQMGYGVEPIQPVTDHLSAFATAEALAGYHSETWNRICAGSPKPARRCV